MRRPQRASFNDSSLKSSATYIDFVTQRSEEVRHQGSGLMSIGGIHFSELGAHPLFLHAELDPEHEEYENENDEPAHLGDGYRHAKESGQNAGVDGVTDHG